MKPWLSTKSQLGDEASVTISVLTAEVIEQTTTLANHHQQSATAVMVVLVVLKMSGEVVDALAERRNLYLGRAGVALVRAVLGDDLGGCLHCA